MYLNQGTEKRDGKRGKKPEGQKVKTTFKMCMGKNVFLS